ncbi:aminoglycoside phosphotransferase family protein [Tuanshanicoccus lijuaniae]|uniref:phosphotransferase enzyme family protein n=2 Tax=Aerococcaceae bacterium zg-1292 TaxID=2774330 RepID=UPI00193663D5|nr:aminoglycoside phosphotransferase family protein [Aerococcaceae bacterium zg-1292]MBS4456998.1 aminoglycoside phosphotransferase family protein [Aerococcaceae bacterium zg-A91]MBS4458737.1 aminoglycoside phosphotransferase family protein [Aerococcaceae bacterium zg-BR33]QQA37517.1 aminoglycoside phosphotransferase family protein [Aerococcaceae bacterium zg-1292]
MKVMTEYAMKAYEQYQLPGEFVSLMAFGNGLINKTYKIIHRVGDKDVAYILQQINHHIFPDVEGLMNNIDKVTRFLKAEARERGGNPERETMTVVPTKDGNLFAKTDDGAYWRIYRFVEGTFCIDRVEEDAHFYEAARAFGDFAAKLHHFDATELVEVIPKFHDTRDRYRQFEEAVANDVAGRVKELADEIAFVRNRKEDCYYLYDLLDAGELPLRVTHNDTKLNNILLDEQTQKGICIVDLDTIMPGLALFDFGDAIRFGANTAAEDEPDLSKVAFDLPLYEVYVKGYLEGSNGILTEREIELLPWGAKVITLEQGIRFLTDYLNGDVYYGTTRPHQNIDRTRVQFKLVEAMEDKWQAMNEVVQRLV